MNNKILASRRKIKKFAYEELLVGLGLIIGAAELSQCGNQI
jgi:hypothetical protein